MLHAELHDPFGHILHTTIAVFALFLAPLGIVPAEVGFWVLVAVSAVRARILFRVWLDVLRWPCTRWLLALIVLALLSLTWSPDPTVGVSRLKFLRTTLWAILLWPVVGDPWARPKLLLGLMAGIATLVATQVMSIAMPDLIATAQRTTHGFGGLHGEHGKTGMWCGAGLCLVAGWSLSGHQHPRRQITLWAMALLFAAGLSLSGSLRILGATFIALLTTTAVVLIRVKEPYRRHLLPLFASIALLFTVLALLTPSALPRLHAQFESLSVSPTSSSSLTSPPTDIELRIVWWGAEVDAFLEAPVLGTGWGSTPSIVADSPRIKEFVARYPAANDEYLAGVSRPVHPHSLYLMVLGELGALGTLLLLMASTYVIASAIGAANTSPLGVGVLCCIFMWFAAAALDSPANANTMALCAIMSTLAMAPAPLGKMTKQELSTLSGGRPRVAIFVEKFGFAGGSERYSQETVSRMVRDGRFEFHVFSNRCNCTIPGASFYRIPMVRFPRSLRPWLFTHLAHRMIERGQYDIVHAHYPLPNATLATLHGTPRRYWVEQVQRRQMSRFDKVSDVIDRLMMDKGSSTLFLPVSSLLESTFRASWRDLPGRWHVLHPGVDSARFARDDEERRRTRASLQVQADEMVLLFVGMNFEHKGLDKVMRSIALATTAPGTPPLRLVVVGRGDVRRYSAMACSLGIESRVSFEGVCEHGIESYYHAADAFIMLSAYETFCMAALEAMAAGLPVIVTSRMGICDLVRDGQHGFVIDADAREDVVSRAILMLADNTLRAQLGEHARLAAAAHDWSSVTARLAEEYERALTEGRAEPHSVA